MFPKDLDPYCLPLFAITPSPDRLRMNSVLDRIDNDYPHNDRRKTLAQVRRWFRKRRERISSRIISNLHKNYSECLEDPAQVNRVLNNIMEDDEIALSLLEGDGNFEDQLQTLRLIRERVRRRLGK